MQINHLQLNTSILKDPKAIINFINENSIDLAFVQEIVYPIDKESPLTKLLYSEYFYEEGIHFHYLPKNQKVGIGIISRWPIIDKTCIYYNSESYQPKEISGNSPLSGELIDDVMTDNFPGSRGLKHSQKSRCILNCLISTPEGLLRAISTHFTVSDLCTETTQMYEMSLIINSLVKNSKDLPTILSADLNIRAQSYSVLKISEVLTCHTKNLKDTLSDKHVAKKTDFPEGLAIDHVFSKGLEHLETNAIEVDFSNHKAVVSKFNLMKK